MACGHEQFVEIGKDTRKATYPLRAKMVCVHCGQVREVHEDGVIKITKEEGEVKR